MDLNNYRFNAKFHLQGYPGSFKNKIIINILIKF